jgi:mRNA-degrading endonuclease toxin of MazEF toxin-antitoxin module
MTQFFRREVYYCDFPSNNLTMPTTLPAPDFNLRGRHMAIMLTDHDNPCIPDGQALVIPISSLKDSVIRKEISSYIPLKPENNLFLSHNSFAKANQIQPVDQSWIKNKVGDLNPKEMNMVNIGVLLATGTYKFVEQYIDQEVTKGVFKALGGLNEAAATRDPLMPSGESYPITGDINDFRRLMSLKLYYPSKRETVFQYRCIVWMEKYWLSA